VAEHLYMKRFGFAVLGGVAVAASCLAVAISDGADPGMNLTTAARIAFPGLVAALVLTAYMAWERRGSGETRGVVSQLSAQLVRKEIEIDRMSSVDELTGLSTRHNFNESVRTEYKRAERYKRPFVVILVEVDDLTELGEQVGKLSKGYVLSEVGAILRTMLRASDLGCRYAPDTLALLLPETEVSEARVVADRIRGLVAAHDFLGHRTSEAVKLTVSQGIAVAPDAAFTSHMDLLRAAEAALATARTLGYDRVAAYEAADMPLGEQKLAG
jgi:diguanylate cyclase (GGDEF)-like protein